MRDISEDEDQKIEVFFLFNLYGAQRAQPLTFFLIDLKLFEILN